MKLLKKLQVLEEEFKYLPIIELREKSESYAKTAKGDRTRDIRIRAVVSSSIGPAQKAGTGED